MEALKGLMLPFLNERVSIPALELFILLIIVSICLLFRATKVGLLLTYIFIMHLTWNFVMLNLSLTSQVAYFLLGSLVLIMGLISVVRDSQ
ncbi:MAG: hypothetical protein WCH86_06795 [Kiritimatiellales bacterium]